jgi:hypothetical protein
MDEILKSREPVLQEVLKELVGRFRRTAVGKKYERRYVVRSQGNNLQYPMRIVTRLSYNEPMRSLRGKLRRGARLLALWPLAGMALTVAQVSQAPTLPISPPPLDGARNPYSLGPDPNQDPALHRAMQEAAKKRNIERQTKLVSDSDRICALAQELIDEINKSGSDKGSRDSLSVVSGKKMDEIQKLAKSVKDRMRSD